MFKDAWGESTDRDQEQIEIIDIVPEDELTSRWEEFIHTHHVDVINSFFKSRIAMFPRRSTESLFDQMLNCKWLDNTARALTPDMTFPELEEHIRGELNEEEIGGILYSSIAG